MKTKYILTFAAVLALPLLADDPNVKPEPKQEPGGGVIKIRPAGQSTYLGVAMDTIPAVLRAQLNLPEGIGIVVSFVAKGSPAQKVGLKANDVITQMDDQLIVNAEQLQTLIKGKKPGDTVSLTYYRQGKEHTAKAKLAKGALTAQGVRRPQPLRLENGEWKPFNVPNGLGLMKQFPLQPGNQEDLQKALDQLREQLENMPNIQPGQLPKGFNFQFGFPGGQGFQIPPMPEVVPGKPGFNANMASSVTIADNTGSYTLKTNNGKKLFTAKDKNGDELFNGPVDNEKQRDALDRNLIKKLEQLEGMGNGKEGIQLRQFRFNGGRAIPRDLDFHFELKPGNGKPEPQPKKKPGMKRSEA
jgi:membrane-associated protease RseP (regulator of RpoE activity)